MRLQRTPKGQHHVNLPQALVEALGWSKGEELILKILGKDRLELKKKA